MPDSGEFFIFSNLANHDKYYVVLTENGKLCKVYTQEDADSVLENTTTSFSIDVINAQLAAAEETLFFLGFGLWSTYIGEPSYENIPGQWHSLTEKQIKQLDP